MSPIPSWIPEEFHDRIREMHPANSSTEKESWVIWFKRPWVFESEEEFGNCYISQGRTDTINVIQNARKIDEETWERWVRE